MSKKKKCKNTFGEAYTVKGTYQKDDGFYTSFEETHVVQVQIGVNEKGNHEKAEKEYREQHKHLKNLKITGVHYQ